MKPPRGVLKKGQEGKVLKLKKGLYGLKQAGRGWYQEIRSVFVDEIVRGHLHHPFSLMEYLCPTTPDIFHLCNTPYIPLYC